MGDVTGSVTGQINSGLATITQLHAATINTTGIITTSAGFNAPAGSSDSRDLVSSGVSTVAFFSGTNIKISGIGTADGGLLHLKQSRLLES